MRLSLSLVKVNFLLRMFQAERKSVDLKKIYVIFQQLPNKQKNVVKSEKKPELMPWLHHLILVIQTRNSYPHNIFCLYLLKEANPSVCNKFRQTPTSPKLFPFSWHYFDELFSPLFLFSEDDKVGTLDVLLSSAYCRSQRFLSKQLAQLRPELTMSMFSGKLKLVFFFLRIAQETN